MKTSIKTWIKMAAFLPLLLCLGGCWDRTELNDLALVTALAIDQAENNQVRATVQFILPQNQSGGGMTGGGAAGGGASKRTSIRTEMGRDITDALSKLQREIPRKMFWGQCRVFIFSESAAKAGIREHLDFLVRFPSSRERAYMFVSKGEAEKTLELFPPSENSSAQVLRKLADLESGMRVTMHQLSLMLSGDSRAAVLPMIHILPKAKSAEPFQTIPYLLGGAVFKEDKMVGEISEKVTRGIMWLRNEIGEYTLVFEAKGAEGLVSLKPVKAKIKLIPKIEGDTWKMFVRVKTHGDIIRNGTPMDPMNPKLLKEMSKGFEEDVKERIELAFDEVQRKHKADIFEFAKVFHRKYPKQWEKVQDRWDEQFSKVIVIPQVEARILRPGLISSPEGLPKEEVKKK
ncbi:MAG: Ger(x)C family spore germination protein [Paenibacillus macerans]|uniref:Ger(X)C family spore germination protein n=1 Tax=Paenibacillus macerans TaxID=44252 RepID=A0A090ZLN6_PAEMA|nr:Ger(x)C family spore germination protein [Paenibacillus macerans]KFN12304.1 germination, Ger(x)C family protein [Paenibacillus macerans]MBS5915040.1 Ger(x)C family spore germination protein [Paenibacillus macerans]MCY7558731.1 Ger(x)C family spore germination protein [Paenibacillus macerans]MDU7476001.1 Ger(x)C family spore germination protein [Paenibacillus macerans]MEC0140559.1 Ger(x)C family spore germination protein [Paenibacillus macerans]